MGCAVPIRRSKSVNWSCYCFELESVITRFQAWANDGNWSGDPVHRSDRIHRAVCRSDSKRTAPCSIDSFCRWRTPGFWYGKSKARDEKPWFLKVLTKDRYENTSPQFSAPQLLIPYLVSTRTSVTLCPIEKAETVASY